MPATPRVATSEVTRAARRRRTWLALAIAFAFVGVLMAQFGAARVNSQPDAPITFIVEGELPYGITQQSVDAAAQTHGALSREPFTIEIVDRPLEWIEHQHGELPEGVDVLFSVYIDPDDVDLSLPSRNSVAFADAAFTDIDYSDATSIRETFLNNLTMGHGPSAVVGAALTAASNFYDGGNRNPLLWGSLAALPLLASCGLFSAYAREAREHRARRRRFDRARLQLARVVLELETLEVQFSAAYAELASVQGKREKRQAEAARKKLRRDWKAVRDESLELARIEQALERDLVNPAAPTHSSVPKEPADLDQFERDVAALNSLADSLAAASSVRVGHANSGAALASLALPTIQATGEVLRQREYLRDRDVARLESQRAALLALVREAERVAGDDPSPEAVREQAELLHKWNDIETRMTATLGHLTRAPQGERERMARERAAQRIRAASGGESDSQSKLRSALGLGEAEGAGPLLAAERVLVSLEGSRGKAPQTAKRSFAWFGAVTIFGPVVVALAVGGVAAGVQASQHPGYGQRLEGDRQLAGLQIYGDVELLPDYEIRSTISDATTNHTALTLDNVRTWMNAMLRSSDDLALLPSDIDLTVAVLPAADYFPDMKWTEEADSGYDRYVIDYADLLAAYPEMFADIGADYPDVFDPDTGEVRVGQVVLPIWVFEGEQYTIGLPLTGEISTGVDSRLGAYFFTATELRPIRPADNDYPTGIDAAVASQLLELGRTLEYNHLETVDEDAGGVFWALSLAVWSALQLLLVLGGAVVEAVRNARGSLAARRALADIRGDLERLALGLDLSELDMVAVLGAGTGERGDAAQAEQRLYEMSLMTAWRQARALESLPRSMQRGPEWQAQVAGLRQLVTTLSERDADVSERALEAIRAGE
ncbi:hypothetical protein [Gulosibacter sediminis]|uniref:hypothetical protein n=1 Tax=Gulosibacter sediminis TaxID=1729695 RepID=UPI0024A9CD76|nr:hypothetical protein [Gulosibacter sediminis]